MQKITCFIADKGDIPDLPDGERVTFIPSGYKGAWIEVWEDYAYNVYAGYTGFQGEDDEKLLAKLNNMMAEEKKDDPLS